MKKLIFGCALMISGMIGAFGWLIAKCALGWNYTSPLSALTYDVQSIVVFVVFIAVAICGAVIAVKSLKADR